MPEWNIGIQAAQFKKVYQQLRYLVRAETALGTNFKHKLNKFNLAKWPLKINKTGNMGGFKVKNENNN